MVEVFGSAFLVKTEIGIEMLIWSSKGVEGKEDAKKFAEIQESIGWGEERMDDVGDMDEEEVERLL